MIRTVLFALLFACLSTSVHAQAFVEGASGMGVNCSHGSNVTFGGGISAYDFSDDGLDDLSIATEAGQPILFYQNSPTGFQQVTFPGITDSFQTKQLIWVDFDNQLGPDLFASSSKGQNILYVNDGSYNFTRTIFPKSLFYADTTIASYGAVFGDFDNDSYLDLYISHYDERVGVPNQLFMNNGNGGFFDATLSAVFNSYNQSTFCTSLVDYDHDLNADIYTAEDRNTINRLYRNPGAGPFGDSSAVSGANVIVNAMGIAVGDYDMDEDLDLYISNTPQGNPMLRNNGDGTFTRVDSLINVSYNRVGWGVNFIDYDNDMDPDLYVSGSTDIDRVQSQLFINDGTGMYQPCPGDSMVGDSTFSFSNAVGDFNNDGYPDLVVNNKGPDSLMIWENQRSGNNWIKIKLRGVQTNVDAIGAWIHVYAGGKHMVRYHGSTTGFVSQNSQVEMFGLGQASIVDEIAIEWANGSLGDVMNNVPVNQNIVISEGSTIIGRDEADVETIKVWPSPAQELVHIRFPEGHPYTSVEVTDLQGRVLKTATPQLGVRDFNLELPGLASGLYLLRFRSPEGNQVRKLLVD